MEKDIRAVRETDLVVDKSEKGRQKREEQADCDKIKQRKVYIILQTDRQRDRHSERYRGIERDRKKIV